MDYNNSQYKKNMEILSRIEELMKKTRGERSVNFEIKKSDGNLTKVSKEEFAWWMVNEKNKDSWKGGVFSLEPENSEIEGQKNELIEENIKDDKKQVENPKESLVYGAKGDINSITYFTEIKSKNGIIKESYYRPRSEEEKKQIREKQEINQKRREQEIADKEVEKIKTENSSNSDKKQEKIEEKVNQQTSLQKPDNKVNNKNIYYGVGLVSLVLLLISVVVVWAKKKR